MYVFCSAIAKSGIKKIYSHVNIVFEKIQVSKNYLKWYQIPGIHLTMCNGNKAMNMDSTDQDYPISMIRETFALAVNSHLSLFPQQFNSRNH